MIKLCVTAPFPEGAEERFGGFEGVEVARGMSDDAEIVFGQPDPDSLKNLKQLKWLQISSAGADRYASRPELFQNVALTTVSGAFGRSISEWTLALVLSLYKRLNLFRDNQQNALWRDEGRQQSPSGKRVLILGCGDLGSAIASVFKPFGCFISGIRRHASAGAPKGFDEVHGLSELDSELVKADIIVGALPGTQETAGLLGRERLFALKPDSVIVNVGRGSLIDLYALADLLKQNRIWGAAIDVAFPEPLPASHPLWRLKNCIVTPHASGGSFGHLKETEEIIYSICRENLQRYLSGGPLLNRLDFATGYRTLEDRYSH